MTEYNAKIFTHEKDIVITEETGALIKEANQVYLNNFDSKFWYGRCIFLSWYCSKGDCKFCYRSTQKHKILHNQNSKRSMGSVLLEALFCKVFNWRIEFLTGGYEIMPFEELLEYAKNISAVYGEKLWLNLGVLKSEELEQIRPYVKGICVSLETVSPKLHDEICPSKPIAPYVEMLDSLKGFQKSAAIIVGLGDSLDEISYLFDFVEKYKLDRVTLYALKPVFGTDFKKGPSHDLYLSWIAKLRIKFPKLEIIGGTNLRRSEETALMVRAGVNAVTKYPATKQFATKKSQILTDQITRQKRIFTSNITKLPEINWEEEINSLAIEDKYKLEMKEKLPNYLKVFENPVDQDPLYK